MMTRDSKLGRGANEVERCTKRKPYIEREETRE